MKKVVQFTNDLLVAGGVQSLIRDYALFIDEEKFEMTILTVFNSSDFENCKILKEKNKTVVSLYSDKYKKLNPIKKIVRIFNIIKQSRIYFKKNKPEVIHIHSIARYIIFSRKYLKDSKLFYTVHNDVDKNFPNTLAGKMEVFCIKKLIKKNNLQMIALHEEMAREVNGFFSIDNAIVVRNAINLQKFNKKLYSLDEQLIKSEIGVNREDFVIGCVGRFEQQKNHLFIIEVFLEVIKIKEKSKLLLIGSGSLKRDIESKIEQYNIKDKVIILENRTDIPELVSIMDVFFLPSIYEGLGIVLIEAQSMGVKCVVSERVPDAANVSNKFVKINLDSDIQVWVNEIMDSKKRYMKNIDILEYDMKNMIKKLEELYEG